MIVMIIIDADIIETLSQNAAVICTIMVFAGCLLYV